MSIGIIGLGKMGLSMALNLQENEIEITGFDLDKDTVINARKQEIDAYNNFDSFLTALKGRRALILSLPAGDITNNYVTKLGKILRCGEYVIDMSNSHYRDSVLNYNILKALNIGYLDCGISGGMEGARRGASLMIGGDKDIFIDNEWVFKLLSCANGYAYVGEAGSGHYLKMIHNGIEYGMMQAIGEGFQVLKESIYEYDLKTVARVWNNGSIIQSYLMELVEDIFDANGDLSGIEAIIDSSGEGRWTVEEALELNLPLPVITSALFARNNTKLEENFSAKLVAGMRNKFGGHKIYGTK